MSKSETLPNTLFRKLIYKPGKLSVLILQDIQYARKLINYSYPDSCMMWGLDTSAFRYSGESKLREWLFRFYHNYYTVAGIAVNSSRSPLLFVMLGVNWYFSIMNTTTLYLWDVTVCHWNQPLTCLFISRYFSAASGN